VGASVVVWLSVWTIVDAPEPWNAVVPLATLAPAGVVLLRKDWHLVGWLLLMTAAISAAQFAESLPLVAPEWQAWLFMVLNVAFWAVMAALVAVFPDGLRLQHGATKSVDRTVVIVVSLATVMSAFTTEVNAAGWDVQTAPTRYDNPLGVGWLPIEASEVLGVLTLLGFIAATINLVVRSRRATGDIRQQFLWVLYPFGLLAAVVPIAIVISQIRGEAGIEWVGAILGYIAIPICFGVAMTRYRLYDIGTIVSRTVSYTLLVAILGALYFGVVTVVAELIPTQNALAVAASTLLAAAMFNPLRRRLQRTVDHRFNRSAYQAEIVSQQFAGLLQESLTTEEITGLWGRTVTEHLQPAASGIWLKQQIPRQEDRPYPANTERPRPERYVPAC
jgi:hypothetical protein